jgi:purine-cytosine permease-like protein
MKNYLLHNILFLIGGFCLYTFIQYFLPIWLSALFTMTIVTIIGVWKERKDKKEGGIFDKWDLIADELGGIEGIVIAILLIWQ